MLPAQSSYVYTYTMSPSQLTALGVVVSVGFSVLPHTSVTVGSVIWLPVSPAATASAGQSTVALPVLGVTVNSGMSIL